MPRLSTFSSIAGRGYLLIVPSAMVLAGTVLLSEEAGAPAPSTPIRNEGPARAGVARLQVLAVNDLHGHLEPLPSDAARGSRRGGAAWLAAHLARAEARYPGRTLRAHAGDMVGASPLLSSYFHDEPTIEALNAMRFDVGAVGNHELDEGATELLRLVRGGRRGNADGLKRELTGRLVNTSSPRFEGASFPTLAANTLDQRGQSILPPYTIIERAGARIGFVGVTTESSADFILPRHASAFRFRDVSATVNRYVRVLRQRGIEAIVVLTHAGGFEREGVPEGEVFDEVREMSDAVDVVISGHSHSVLNVRIPNRRGHASKLVVQAGDHGRAFGRIELGVDRRTGEVVQKRARVIPTTHRGLRPDPAVDSLVRRYAERLRSVADRALPKRLGRGRERSELGRFVARAQRDIASADIAFVDPVSIRAGLGGGPITYSDLFDVLPYEHPLMRARIRGEDLTAVLAKSASRKLYSSGLRRPVVSRATYTVAASELLMTGRRAPLLRDRSRGAKTVGNEVEALVNALER